MQTRVYVENIEVGDIWQDKKVVATDPKDSKSAVYKFMLEGETHARCFEKGTEFLVERDVKMIEAEAE